MEGMPSSININFAKLYDNPYLIWLLYLVVIYILFLMSIYGGRYELLAHNCFFRRKFRPPLAKAVGFLP